MEMGIIKGIEKAIGQSLALRIGITALFILVIFLIVNYYLWPKVKAELE